jgi:hypothetical protein
MRSLNDVHEMNAYGAEIICSCTVSLNIHISKMFQIKVADQLN